MLVFEPIKDPAHGWLLETERQIEVTHMVYPHGEVGHRGEEIAPVRDVGAADVKPCMPADLAQTRHGPPHGGGFVRLAPALAEMKTRAAYAHCVEPLQLPIAHL